jgi:hypothetical protein
VEKIAAIWASSMIGKPAKDPWWVLALIILAGALAMLLLMKPNV